MSLDEVTNVPWEDAEFWGEKAILLNEGLRYFSTVASHLFPEDCHAQRQEFLDLALDFLVDAIAKGRVTRGELSFRIILHRTQREFFRRQARQRELEAASLDQPLIGPDGEEGSFGDFVAGRDGVLSWETVFDLVADEVREALLILAAEGSVNTLAKQMFRGNWRKARKFVAERVVPELARAAGLLGFNGDPEESVKALLYALRDREVTHGPKARGPGGGPGVGDIGAGKPPCREGGGGDLGGGWWRPENAPEGKT